MIVLAGADLVLPDRILGGGSLVIEGDRIIEIGERAGSGGGIGIDLRDHYVVPAFVDVHVHGLGGFDAMGDGAAIASMAARQPRHGVAGFCPTTVASPPDDLRRTLAAVKAARTSPPAGARVLGAHIESNFINPDFRGAQPAACLRRPPPSGPAGGDSGLDGANSFDGTDIVKEIQRAVPDVAIVTLAPELPGALDLIRTLTREGVRVSLGHSAASFEEGLAGIEAGARHATHLFNRMPPLQHRQPGLAGAVLLAEEVAAELICDGYHVHPGMVRMTVRAKRASRVMAVTDGTAGAGLPPGSRAMLGGQALTVTKDAAFLADGTLAGSVLTMDEAFRRLVGVADLSVVEAATVCATTPARELGLAGHGVLAAGAVADLAVLDRHLAVVQTYIGGVLAYNAPGFPVTGN